MIFSLPPIDIYTVRINSTQKLIMLLLHSDKHDYIDCQRLFFRIIESAVEKKYDNDTKHVCFFVIDML